jgi:anti-sigma regulatory factor (Ser/Thr protein kinase)
LTATLRARRDEARANAAGSIVARFGGPECSTFPAPSRALRGPAAKRRSGDGARRASRYSASKSRQDLVAAMNTGSSVPPQAGLSASCEIRIDNNLSEITRVADMVDDFAARHQFPEQVLFALNVALDEIINNIISYGYEDAGHHEIAVRVALRPGNVEAVVEDDGKPFDPLAAPAPDLTSTQREPGGVGLHFVRNLMDEVTYTRRDGINHLRLMKRLEP